MCTASTHRLPRTSAEKVTALLVETVAPVFTVVVVAANPGISAGVPVVHDARLAPLAHPASSDTW